MTHHLNRTAAVLEDCIKHIESTGAEGSSIEAYLTQHLLVILCADIEVALLQMIEVRAKMTGDDKLASFCLSAAKKVIRSVRKCDLADILGNFGDSCRVRFNETVDDRVTTAYSNAVQARHKVAHSAGIQMTLREFTNAFEATEVVLNAFEISLV